MPKVHQCTAVKDRYRIGLKVPSEKTKSGFRHDYTKPADENDTVFCPKGETYFWFKFRYGGKNFSRTRPRNSQLTQSEFYGFIYSFVEAIQDYYLEEDEGSVLEGQIEEWTAELQEHADEIEEN